MTRARALFSRAQPSTPRCEHALVSEETIRWHKYRGTDHERCGNQSRYKIGRKFYCGKHAGAVALRILMENKE